MFAAAHDPELLTVGRFTGLRALVTGGASGIGLAVLRLLSAEGAHVVSLDRDPAATEDWYSVVADVADEAAVAAAVQDAVRVLGGLDLLVNSAGIGAQGRVEDHDDGDWQRVFAVNVFGLAHVTKAGLPSLRASNHGSIVNVSSIAATAGLPHGALYSASKGAVLALTRALAADLLPDGIRVNAVSPPLARRRVDNRCVAPRRRRHAGASIAGAGLMAVRCGSVIYLQPVKRPSPENGGRR